VPHKRELFITTDVTTLNLAGFELVQRYNYSEDAL
jgi:hypothetical protein